MRVLFIRHYDGQGDSRCQKEMLCLSKKHSVTFLGWDRSSSYSKPEEKDLVIQSKSIKSYFLGIKAPIGGGMKKLFFPLIKFWIKEWRFLLKEGKKYDVIHACDFGAAFPLLFVPKRFSVVYDIYDYFGDSLGLPKPLMIMAKKLETSIINKSDSVVICSEKRVEQIQPANPKVLTIIHNSPSVVMCVDSDLTARKCGRYSVVYVGLLIEHRFLREITEVICERDDIEFHVGGYGPLEQFFIERACECDNVIFYGKLKYEDVLALEKQCDIMTAIYDPSIQTLRYAAPNKFYESLMLKKPVIMMRNTGMDDYVEEYQLGEVIDERVNGFKAGFSRALDNLINHKDMWIEMGDRGYKLYKEMFAWEEMETRLLNMYDTLQNQKRKI